MCYPVQTPRQLPATLGFDVDLHYDFNQLSSKFAG
ncbi:MAG: hypothetical protein ACJAW0_001647 [Zhongshania sp.]|jgi:hypothetical protein